MSRRILLALLTAAAGCSNTPGALDVGSREAALQQLACPGGVEATGPNLCMTVPPVNKPAPSPDAVWDPWVVDGTKTKTEYFGAIDFPYVHPGLKLSGGHVFVNIEQNLKTLHVFVQNAPGLLKGEIRVYIDNGRFKTSPDGDTTFNEPTSEDRAYAIDLTTGAKAAPAAGEDERRHQLADVPAALPARAAVPAGDLRRRARRDLGARRQRRGALQRRVHHHAAVAADQRAQRRPARRRLRRGAVGDAGVRLVGRDLARRGRVPRGARRRRHGDRAERQYAGAGGDPGGERHRHQAQPLPDAGVRSARGHAAQDDDVEHQTLHAVHALRRGARQRRRVRRLAGAAAAHRAVHRADGRGRAAGGVGRRRSAARSSTPPTRRARRAI